MQFIKFKSLWEYVDFEGSPLTIRMKADIDRTLGRIAEAGYAGVECPLPAADQEPLLRGLLEKHDLEFIAQVLTEGPDHAESFARQVDRAKAWNPLLIVSQSGKDHNTLEEQLDYFRRALEVEAEAGIPIAHETHRGRALYTPWRTAELLETLPDLRIAADFSHWCCVAESLLEDHADSMKLACERAIHIHGRVGHREGPQVGDPRAPEYSRELSAHERWWERIVRNRIADGAKKLAFTPEFGPPGYMPTHPFTREPVADLWEVNLWMAERFDKLAENVVADREVEEQ